MFSSVFSFFLNIFFLSSHSMSYFAFKLVLFCELFTFSSVHCTQLIAFIDLSLGSLSSSLLIFSVVAFHTCMLFLFHFQRFFLVKLLLLYIRFFVLPLIFVVVAIFLCFFLFIHILIQTKAETATATTQQQNERRERMKNITSTRKKNRRRQIKQYKWREAKYI